MDYDFAELNAQMNEAKSRVKSSVSSIDNAPYREQLNGIIQSLDRTNEELARQAAAQERIDQGLHEEAAIRNKEDTKKFWLGVLFSFVISMTVEHGSTLLQLLLTLIRTALPA